jgi:hypothetical protein
MVLAVVFTTAVPLAGLVQMVGVRLVLSTSMSLEVTFREMGVSSGVV